jgi:hypothetical protein
MQDLSTPGRLPMNRAHQRGGQQDQSMADTGALERWASMWIPGTTVRTADLVRVWSAQECETITNTAQP